MGNSSFFLGGEGDIIYVYFDMVIQHVIGHMIPFNHVKALDTHFGLSLANFTTIEVFLACFEADGAPC